MITKPAPFLAQRSRKRQISNCCWRWPWWRQGAFHGVSPGPAQGGVFIGLGSKPDQKPSLQESREQTLEALHTLLCTYMTHTTGYQSRRLLRMEAPGPYDHLARFGEWDSATLVSPQQVS